MNFIGQKTTVFGRILEIRPKFNRIRPKSLQNGRIPDKMAVLKKRKPMTSTDKKLSVLHQLSQESEPIGMQELLIKLGAEYVERTVRRWLIEMVADGLVEKSGQKRGTKYLVIQRTKRKTGEWLKAYQPNKTFYLPSSVRQDLLTAGKRSKRNDPLGIYARQIYNRLAIDLSFNSSRLEGNTYSLSDTQRLVLEGKSAEGKLEEEKAMILNHKEAIRYLVDNAPKLKVNRETICTLHYLLADGFVEPRFAGKVKDHGLQTQLERIVGKGALIEDPFEQSLFLLVHVTYLQAFTDVNKRTGRLSANIPLIKNNLVPLSFNDVEREDYASAIIAVYELQDVRPIIDLFIFSYMRTCAMYDSTVKAIGFDEIRVRYRYQRRGLISEIIQQKIVGSHLKEFIDSKSLEIVEEKDRNAFVEDLWEDLKEIDRSRIAGLGITPEQLSEWLEINPKN